MSLLHKQTEWNNIRLLLIGFVVNVFIGIILNVLDSVASHKYVCSFFWTEYAQLHQVVSDAVNFAEPFTFCAMLLFFANLELVRVCIAINSVYCKLIFKEHGESFYLIWKIYKDSLWLCFSDSMHVLLKFLRLTFLDGLRDFNHCFVKRSLVHDDLIVLNFLDV